MPGTLVWITGLSGAGKSTLAEFVAAAMRERGRNPVVFHGDDFRALVGDGIGYSVEERRVSALRICRFCHYIAGQGVDVVCATVSMFHQVRECNRSNNPRYVEVFLDVPMEVLAARTPIYSRLDAALTTNVAGADIPAELPQTPDYCYKNVGSLADLETFAVELATATVTRRT